jgi:hypothetical protein
MTIYSWCKATSTILIVRLVGTQAIYNALATIQRFGLPKHSTTLIPTTTVDPRYSRSLYCHKTVCMDLHYGSAFSPCMQPWIGPQHCVHGLALRQCLQSRQPWIVPQHWVHGLALRQCLQSMQPWTVPQHCVAGTCIAAVPSVHVKGMSVAFRLGMQGWNLWHSMDLLDTIILWQVLLHE